MLHLPQTWEDWPVVVFFWSGGLFTLFYEFFIVFPTYHEDSWNAPVFKYHLTVALALAVIIYTYMILIMMSDVTTNSLNYSRGEVVNASDWKFCEKCQRNSPPRSHHCKLCNTCILKRDHHCFFAGYCIGFQNQRYFICMTFYASIAAVYCNIYNWEFVLATKGGFTWSTIPSLMAPHFGLCFGYYTIYEFFITALTSLGGFVTLFLVWLFILQIDQLLKGQVKYEKKKGIVDYSLGLQNTMNEIFGSAGLLVFLCPFISTKFPSDGTYFPKQDEKKLM